MNGSVSGRLAGTTAIVTGLGSGIGQGCALMFARHGARVLSCDIDAAGAEEGLALARAEGLEIESLHPCDLTQPDQVERLVATAMERFGQLDILVNAAAFCEFAPIEQMDYERQWRRTLVGELDIVFLLCKAAWPYLKLRGGSIINFASVNAQIVVSTLPALAHAAGKGGVLAMTRQLAIEGAPFGIRANTISPALVVSKTTRKSLEDPAFRHTVLDKMMIKRFGQPKDIAWCAVYLASDEATWVTAADFAIDGGTARCG
jgi:NAD(P)-dependent dehydrogenase (short-subunit alcohol dehydrogenase family)